LKRYVIDASVAVKWLVPEIHAERAMRLLDENHVLMAPDLVFAEIGNVLLKKSRMGEIATEAALEMLTDFKGIPLQIYKTDALLEYAWDIADTHKRSFCDSLYIALAMRTACRMVTADLKLISSLKTTAVSKHMLWVEDIP